MRYIWSISITLLLLLVACGTPKTIPKEGNCVYVSIAPLRYLVERIADSTLTIEVLVPETTSPETYEPTTAQIKKLADASLYFNVGLIDFETELNKSIRQISDSLTVVDLSQGVQVMAGSCSHTHNQDEHTAHGKDPHIWLSPTIMRSMAERITAALIDKYPQHRELLESNALLLKSDIDSLDRYIRSKNLSTFAIGHPSLTYFASDYGVEQIAVEIEGKEPSLAQMKDISKRIKELGIVKIIYNSQISPAAAQAIANQTGAHMVDFDPLAGKWLDNMYYITNQIAR